MHPALSVIFFTTASGAGYGLLALLGVLAAMGLVPAERGFGLAAFALSLGAITFGLLSSTFHLGHPERAWRAFSQWRSSWLSREGVLAVASYLPLGAFAVGWIVFEQNGGWWAVAGLIGAGFAVVTTACTGMIYASLRPIQRWANGWTVPNYLLLALMTGALWLQALLRVFAIALPVMAWLAVAAILAAAAAKLLYWRHIDGAAGASTAGTATGLGHLGQVRLLEAPHTGDNYLLREMGYRIARKHASKLRRIAVAAAFILPFLLCLPALAVPAAGWSAWPAAAAIAAVLAALSASLGVLVERWLFFAEARHKVMLYYGAAAA
jgi:DMSO reductase anchor subunit